MSIPVYVTIPDINYTEISSSFERVAPAQLEMSLPRLDLVAAVVFGIVVSAVGLRVGRGPRTALEMPVGAS